MWFRSLLAHARSCTTRFTELSTGSSNGAASVSNRSNGSVKGTSYNGMNNSGMNGVNGVNNNGMNEVNEVNGMNNNNGMNEVKEVNGVNGVNGMNNNNGVNDVNGMNEVDSNGMNGLNSNGVNYDRVNSNGVNCDGMKSNGINEVNDNEGNEVNNIEVKEVNSKELNGVKCEGMNNNGVNEVNGMNALNSNEINEVNGMNALNNNELNSNEFKELNNNELKEVNDSELNNSELNDSELNDPTQHAMPDSPTESVNVAIRSYKKDPVLDSPTPSTPDSLPADSLSPTQSLQSLQSLHSLRSGVSSALCTNSSCRLLRVVLAHHSLCRGNCPLCRRARLYHQVSPVSPFPLDADLAPRAVHVVPLLLLLPAPPQCAHPRGFLPSSSFSAILRAARRPRGGVPPRFAPNFSEFSPSSATLSRFPRFSLISSTWQLFWEPVRATAEYCWDYYQVISHPTDLSAMTVRASRGEYRSVQQFSREARRLVANALRYNEVGAGVSFSLAAGGSVPLRAGVSAGPRAPAARARAARRHAPLPRVSRRQRALLHGLRGRRRVVPRGLAALRGGLRARDRGDHAVFRGPGGAFRVLLRVLPVAVPAGMDRGRGGGEARAGGAGERKKPE